MKRLNSPLVWGLFFLVLMLISALLLQQKFFNKPTGAQNLEATYHVLLTVTALSESAAAKHFYLPTVSLGDDLDKGIPWGATVPTKTGDYIYTSFTPLGFLAPYFLNELFDLEISIKNLAYFNFILGSLSVVTLFILLVNLLIFNGSHQPTAVTGALVGSTIAIFSREAMLSHGVVYWHQSLYQPILIFSLYLFFKYLTIDTKSNSKGENYYSIALIVIAFVGASTEWTGYIFNTGIVGILWLNSKNLPSSKTLARRIFMATALAGVVTVIHYGLVVGFEQAIRAFVSRFLARDASSGSIVALIQGYGLSYGFFFLVIFSILLISFVNNKQQSTNNQHRTVLLIFIASCIPLLENIVMLQHATQFSYDRLKFIFPASIVLAISYARFEAKARVILTLLILTACFQGLKSYRSDLENYSRWAQIDHENRRLVQNINQEVDLQCAVLASNSGVRGYANLILHRGIFEYKTFQQAEELGRERNSCAVVYLEGSGAFSDLPRYYRAIIKRNNGSIEVINKSS